MTTTHLASSKLLGAALVVALRAGGRWLAQQPAAASRQRTAAADHRRASRITGDPGTPPRLAVPDLLALSTDRETQDAAQGDRRGAVGRPEFRARVLHDSARHLQVAFPPAPSIDAVPFDRWRELGADGVVIGTVQKAADRHPRRAAAVQRPRAAVRVYGREYTGSAANPRIYAHTMSDELHESQRKLRGVARTKLTFSSDRNREAGGRHRREARRQGDLRRRLRRRQPAAHHHQPDAEHLPELVAGRPVDRLHVVPDGRARHPDLEHLRRHDGDADQGRRPELAAGVLARRHAHRLHVEPRRQSARST